MNGETSSTVTCVQSALRKAGFCSHLPADGLSLLYYSVGTSLCEGLNPSSKLSDADWKLETQMWISDLEGHKYERNPPHIS